MQKTPVVFVVDHATSKATPVVRPGQEWVLRGEGKATIKFDGTACLWQDDQLWKRFDRKLGKQAQRRLDRGENIGPIVVSLFRVAPAGFIPCEPAPDSVTFHWPGWVPISTTDPTDKWHREALAYVDQNDLVPGQTYELVGPSLGLNPYALDHHELWAHGREVVDIPERTFEILKEWLATHKVEGLVFHHPDGRLAKLRRKDFGLFWVQEDTRAHHRPKGNRG